MLRNLFIACCAMLATAAYSQPLSIHPDYSLLPDGHDVALLVTDANSGETLYQQRQNKLQPPASTQKMITALAARLYLGPEFRFATTLEKQGDDIVIRFGGDPTLSREQLSALLGKLKKQGIKGDILLNGSQFSGHEQAPGWPWDILGVCYSAPASSMSLDHNCVQGALYSNKATGELTRIHIPAHQPIAVSTNAIIVSKEEQKTRHCDLELTTGPGNQYQLGGCLAQRKQPLPLNFAVQDTEQYIAAVIKQELKRRNIRFSGNVRRDDNANGKIIATHRSAPLSKLLDTMVKESDNLIADNLAKTLGQRYFEQPGTFANGTEAIKAIIKNKTGIDLAQAVLADGSGLSRNNRLTAEQMMAVLTYLYSHDKTLALSKTFPVSGQSGTLLYRQSIRHQPLKGKIHAKSGSLYGTYNLAGRITTSSGRELLFVQMVTNYHPLATSDDAPKSAPAIESFEQDLYRQLYSNY